MGLPNFFGGFGSFLRVKIAAEFELAVVWFSKDYKWTEVTYRVYVQRVSMLLPKRGLSMCDLFRFVFSVYGIVRV